MRRFDGKPISEMDEKRFRMLVENHRWCFAKTYAAFCPHEYTLRKEWRDAEFKWLAQFVWKNGFYARYGKITSKYFIDEETGWYYFVFPNDVDADVNILDSMTLLNRSTLNQFEFVQEETMFGAETICKRLPKEKRKPFN